MYYVIQVKTGQEDKTIDAIRRKFAEDLFFDVFSPYRVGMRKIRGVYKEVKERCFPGYIFVDTDNPKDVFYGLYWVTEFTKMLGREGHTDNFVPLNPDESRMIDILYSKNTNRITEISNIVVKEGQDIRVLDGPLQGMIANIKKIDLHKRTVKVEVPFCGRMAEVSVGINIITDVINK